MATYENNYSIYDEYELWGGESESYAENDSFENVKKYILNFLIDDMQHQQKPNQNSPHEYFDIDGNHMDYREYIVEKSIDEGRHLYFDDDGNEISRLMFLAMQAVEKSEEEKKTWGLIFEHSGTEIMARHPLVVLNFLRFIDSYNEFSLESELSHINPIPIQHVKYILKHPWCLEATEYDDDYSELKDRLFMHMDISELPQEVL